MKTLSLTTAVSLVIASPVAGFAQDSLRTEKPAVEQAAKATPVLEPGVIYLVVGDSLRKLDTVPLDKDKSVGGIGALVSIATLSDVAGEQFWGVLAGPTSDLELADSQPRFRVKLEKAKAMSIRLGKFARDGKRRRARIDTNHPVDFFNGKYRIETTLTKVDEDLFEITPAKPLKPGEYGLALTGNGPVADFHIAEPKKEDKKGK